MLGLTALRMVDKKAFRAQALLLQLLRLQQLLLLLCAQLQLPPF